MSAEKEESMDEKKVLQKVIQMVYWSREMSLDHS